MGTKTSRTNYKPSPCDVHDEEWSFVAPYLTLSRLDGANRKHDLRAVFNALRWLGRSGAHWRDAARIPAVAGGISADATLAGGGLLRGNGARPADAAAGIRGPQEPAQRGNSEQPYLQSTPESGARTVQKLTGKSVKLTDVDQGYTSATAHQAAQTQDIELAVVKHTEVKRGFVPPPIASAASPSCALMARKSPAFAPNCRGHP